MALEVPNGWRQKDPEAHAGKSRGCFEETVGGNADGKGDYAEGSGRREEAGERASMV